MSYCPACGNPVPDAAARFCMKCGRELPGAVPTPTQISPAPPPPYVVGTPGPSPAAQFTGRVFAGNWSWAALAALVPAVVLLVVAGGLGTWSQHAFKSDEVGWSTRSRIALALTVQGLGGHLTVHDASRDSGFSGFGCASGDDDDDSGSGYYDDGTSGDDGDDYGDDGSSDYGDDGSDYGDDYGDDGSSDYGDDGSDFGDDYGDDGSDFGDDFGDDGSDFGDGTTTGFTQSYGYVQPAGYVERASSDCAARSAGLSVVPLSFTLVWLLALVLVLRAVRGRGAGPEAAVRVALLSAVASTVLALIAQPSLRDVEVHSGPWRVLVWSFLLSLAVALVVLDGPALRARFGAAYRVLGAALLGLLVTVLFAGVVVYAVAVGNHEHLEATGLVVTATILPNLGLAGLGLGWGAPFKVSESIGSHEMSRTYGLTRLNHFWDGSATPLAVLGGVLCALAIGLIAAARTRSRAEQFAVVGAFTAMFTVLVAIGGISSGGVDALDALYTGSGSHSHAGTEVSQALLFALLWSFGGVLVAPALRRLFGVAPPPPVYSAGGPQGAYGPPSPYAPPPFGAPHVPAQQAPPPAGPYDLGVVQPERLTEREEQERRDEGGGAHR
ncbi:zinc ribbon domain-containing protein [Actinacidiphila epipremni]|uniref:Zinc ribbon domain-containing protein n=1 Tax=Actinacidiphila epipremni TaxID=2053013 RepID=A0ABX1A1J5_9ACTN|nr:zinc ribbon domain-containing protein [Actinacidiphila epipremni]NJP47713.1 zinc ribbon domain-containing protein [Actinacidiphila epipremni]